ncbi:MAG: PorT family protein [Muribaculaceae bacterium]|nr:PorT family protein [Muribaculaceae bacterium]
MNTIKKILIALCVILASAGIAQAKPIAFGVKAGLNVNSIKFNKDIKDLVSSDNSCGWTAGVMADFTVPIIGIGCDVSLMYSRMNNSSNVEYNRPIIPGDVVSGSTVVANYDNDNLYGKNFLEIPINLKYKLTLPVISNYLKPYVFTGPNFAFRLDKSVSNSLQNIKSRTCQVAWNVGLGIELVNHVQIGASYAFGINNVVEKITNEINVADIKAKNNYWTVSAAYLF